MKQTFEERFGKYMLRFQEADEGFIGIVVGRSGERFSGKTVDEVRSKLVAHVLRQGTEFIGYDGAISHFLRHFPEGFDDLEYLEVRERGEKLEAARLLSENLPVAEAVDGSGMAEIVEKVFNAIRFQLIAWQEKATALRMLRGTDGDAFVRAAARFCLSGEKADLSRLKAVAANNEADKWTIVTYLPWLWQPERHMFLKPEATKSFAKRVGHAFQIVYENGDSYETYTSCTNLAGEILAKAAKIGPRDNIDAQGFIWVSEKYPRLNES